jgi:hypothetical protein
MDMDYFARRRDRGLSPLPRPGVGMFEDEYEDEEDAGDDQDGDDQAGGDQAGGDLDGAEEESDDELLPDLDMPARGEPSKKRQRKEKKIWSWKEGDLEPKEMPENTVKPKMEGCNFPVEYFMKMFGKESFQLLLEQTNIQRVQVRFFSSQDKKCTYCTVPYQ